MQLLKISKISKMDYEETTLLPVSFAPLILPRKEDKMKQIHMGMKNSNTIVNIIELVAQLTK